MPGITRRGFAIAAAASASAWLGRAQTSAPTSIDDDVILRAMRDELERSRQLRVVASGDDAPYYISYSLTDSNDFHVSAEMGAPLSVGRNRFRVPVVEVRTGSYDFDHTGHMYSGVYTGSHYDSEWPLDDRYETIRERLWLETDRAFKTALESMARKRAALSGSNARAEKLGDFYPADPVRSLAKVTFKKLDEAAWTSRVVKLSAVFNAYPEVLFSGVEFQAIDGVTYLMNSEGTSIRYDDSVAVLYAKAEGQSPDGMLLHDAVSFQGLNVDRIPSEAQVLKRLTELAGNIRDLTHAPAGEGYSGPVLFEPHAAAQLFAFLLGENLRVPRKPLADPGRNVSFVASELESKMGSRILPDWLDVTDDPAQTSWQGAPLAGYYPFDVEGVPGKAVKVVEKGMLKAFLTTRQPVRGIAASNGHARLGGSYGAYEASISNLFITVNQGGAADAVPLTDLKKKLIDTCKERGKPYGMLVRKLDLPFSGSSNDLRALASSGGQSGGSVRPVSPPILVYRVHEDGREELVRGLRFRGLSTRTLRDILAASQEVALFEFVNNSTPLAPLGAGGYMAPVSVVAPGVLFDEIEFELPQDQLPKPPVVPPPNATG